MSVTLDWNKHMFAEIPAQFFKDFSNYSDEIPGKIKAIDKYVSLGEIIKMEQENGFKEEKKFYKVHQMQSDQSLDGSHSKKGQTVLQ